MIQYRIIISLLVVGVLITSCKKEEESCNETVSVDLGDDQIIQEGSSVDLNAGVTGMTYLWSTGETTQSITVNETGEYWVQVSSCSHTDSDTVLVEVSYPTIKIETGFGNFRIWLYNETPLHKANFLDLTNQSFYDGLIFHRVVEDFVIQGGDPDGTGFGGPGYTIPAEIIPGLDHDYGAVGAARQASIMDSNGSQFYIVCDQNGEPGLNGDYTVFGIIFEGIDVVYDISLVPVDANHKPDDDVIMNDVKAEYYTAQELSSQFGFILP